MPLQATSGAASYDAFGGGVAAVPNYIEDVFSTYLYTGNGSTQTITNGIDLAGEGGLVWLKNRSAAASNNLYDTNRGTDLAIQTNSTAAQLSTATYGVDQYLNAGFVVGGSSNNKWSNYSGDNYASWTFRKQPKFFDVVTGTTNASGGATFSHSLGSSPGCIIVKATGTTSNWGVWHRSIPNGSVYLNLTNAQDTSDIRVSSATSTSVTITNTFWLPANQPFVAYLFAHDAGGFGLTGTDNVISCGSVSVTNGSYADVNLGYEPQFVMLKASSTTGAWFMNDTMRGMPARPSLAASLSANSSAAEVAGDGPCFASSTGFTVNNNNVTGTYIYIAIRRGPMKVPTSGTSVFSPVTTTGTGTNSRVITGVGFSPDMIINCTRGSSALDRYTQDRLRGLTQTIYTNTSGAEQTGLGIYAVGTLDMTGFTQGTSAGVGFNSASDTYVFECFKRAPSFFDEVCYTGTGANRTVTHNLGVVPEMMIVKQRQARDWVVYIAPMGNNYFACLNDGAFQGSNSAMWNDTTPTASVFTVGTNLRTNVSAGTYVAYLFATCAGVSKVGSYTGTGTTQQINCGFTGGARFVLIKRTDSTGDWYVWDSARGIVAGNDPYLLLNTTAAEVTSTDYIDTYSAGFEISSTAPAAINASGGTFIFLAIA